MPLLHLLAGPNGSGKTTFYEEVLRPVTGLVFINADAIARERWPDAPEANSYRAAQLAEAERGAHIEAGRSFIAETVFSHPSKLALIRQAQQARFLVTVHVMLVPLALSLRRVEARVRHGGHAVPVEKQHERYARLWPLLAEALMRADEGVVYDNTSARSPYRVVARCENGTWLGAPVWPSWADLQRHV